MPPMRSGRTLPGAGVPRYWELASEYGGQEEALEDLVWNRRGVLHEEPGRLLLDDLRSAVQPYSILSLIGSGCHRPAEISARMAKPLSSLARPLAQLCELGYVRRDVPFGEDPKKTRRALYRLNDPFLRFYFRFVLPYESSLAQGIYAWKPSMIGSGTARVSSRHAGEELCRASVPWIPGFDPPYGAASAWSPTGGQQADVDVVALSLDRKSLLLGECKWSDREEAVRPGRRGSTTAREGSENPCGTRQAHRHELLVGRNRTDDRTHRPTAHA